MLLLIVLYIVITIIVGLGSIAGQDIFQRVMASRSEKVAVRSAFLAGFMYLSVAMVPLLLALAARSLMPQYLETHGDTQFLIPVLIMEYTSPFIQVLLFGALLSAILSTASSALLAPAAILGENLVRPRLNKVSDRQLLWVSRLSVLVIALIAMGMAIQRGNIYELVGEAASVGLVSLFVPLVGGLAWKKITQTAAIASMVSGLAVWLLASWADPAVEPIMFGLTASVLGLIGGQTGSTAKKKITHGIG
jgi:solute:Na+ symporter, SSS family